MKESWENDLDQHMSEDAERTLEEKAIQGSADDVIRVIAKNLLDTFDLDESVVDAMKETGKDYGDLYSEIKQQLENIFRGYL